MERLQEVLWKARFREWMQVRHWSSDTVDSYEVALGQFFRFLVEQGVTRLSELDRELVEGYRNELFYRRHRGKPLAVATQQTRLGAIKTFVRFLAQEGYLLTNVAAELELPRVPKRLPEVLSEAEVLALLEGVDTDSPFGVRDRAILELLYGSGLRNQEAVSLRLSDLDWARKLLVVRHGKGGHSRAVPFGDEARSWLAEYLKRVRPLWQAQADEDRLLLNRSGRPLTRHALIDVVSSRARRAGLEKTVTPHVLRHSCATHMMARGAGLRHLQIMLGHASSVTTEHYTRVELSELRAVLQRCHPRERCR